VQEQATESASTASNACYAKLVGFGTQKAAISFAERLKKQGINVQIKTNISKTAQGKKRIWYQAITPEYSSMQALDQDINKIVKIEHIKKQDVQIIQLPLHQ
jgi:organic radical activating enzyme